MRERRIVSCRGLYCRSSRATLHEFRTWIKVRFPHRGDRCYCYASPTDGGWCCGATCLQHCLVQTPGIHHKLLQVFSPTLWHPLLGSIDTCVHEFLQLLEIRNLLIVLLFPHKLLSDFCQPLPRKIRVQGHCISYFLAGSEFKPGMGEAFLQAFVGHVSNTSVSCKCLFMLTVGSGEILEVACGRRILQAD